MLPDPLFWNVHMYGVMIAVGILCTFAVLYLYGKRLNVDIRFLDFCFYNAIASIAIGFGSASLFDSFYDYLKNPEKGFRLTGGMTFIGGLIGGVVCFLLVYVIMRRRLHGRLAQIISIAPCCITIAHAFGRVGCFFAGCCYGKVTDGPFGVLFPGHTQPVHPTQLYEAFFLFVVFGICSYLVLAHKFRHNMSIYLIAYGIFRYLIEFVRDDDRGTFIGSISPSQFWSIVMVVLGIVIPFAWRYVERKYPPAPIPAESDAEDTAEEDTVEAESEE